MYEVWEFEPGDASRDLSFVKKGKIGRKDQRGIVGDCIGFVEVIFSSFSDDELSKAHHMRYDSWHGFVNGTLETGGVMDKCVQMWTRNYDALDQTARVCFGVLCANKKKEEVKRDFGDLRIRRSEGRVVNTPLV
ncbi:hypothetical protein TNCV_2497641 [Trichonephila clavipes]|nr:hypothetical protein TNCV_2497641 [Trichonephila clavipes]